MGQVSAMESVSYWVSVMGCDRRARVRVRL